MKEFKFITNEYKSVCYVFIDVNRPPIDTLILLDRKDDKHGCVSVWMSCRDAMQTMMSIRTNELDNVKEFYNQNYEEIYEEVCPKYLLELPDIISGYYLDHNCNEIAITDLRTDEDRFGIANTLEQARGMTAFCELSHILPVFNGGWEPNWDEETIKHRIRTYEDGAIQVCCTFGYPAFLAFETEEKAKLFLKEKIDLITDLSKAGII